MNMASLIHGIYRSMKRISVLKNALDWMLRNSRNYFWSLRPAPAPAQLPEDFVDFIKSGLGEEPFTLVEVGCGDGRVLRHLAQQFPRSRFVGVDIQKAAVAHGTSLAASEGLSNVALHCATCLDDTVPWDCDYLISRTALIYLNSEETRTFLNARLPHVRRKLLLQEIISQTGKEERSHFFAQPLPALIAAEAPDQFTVTATLLDYAPWKQDPAWSGANLIATRTSGAGS